jgi:hypothetical protein
VRKKKKSRLNTESGAITNNLNLLEPEEGEDIRVNMLIYGLTGVGKTRFLGTAQKCPFTSPVLFIDIEGGTLSVAGSGIKIVRPQNFSEIQDIYDFLRFENTTYKSVAIDSLTEMQRKLSMGDILGVLEDDASYTNLAGHVPADRYDWLSSGEQMRRNIRAFRDLAYMPDRERRIHVLFTALERVDEKRNIVCPALPGALGLEVGASVDVLGRMSIKQMETAEGRTKKIRNLTFREFTGEDGNLYMAKARTPEHVKFPQEIWKPTVDKILSIWMNTDETTSEED